MNIRNFALIAHVDHGKSTLADRIMELCGAVGRDHRPQILDSLELEREHGITIKLKAIRLNYELITHNSSLIQNYVLNLIDTPGHVDFSYEVSRSLSSVEGAVLVVDATQGVQAQTIANFNLAREAGLTIIPVVNKIDLPHAQIKKTHQELQSLGFDDDKILNVSAKTGDGVENLLKAIIERIPPPTPANTPGVSKTQALVFDSSLDPYKGVIATVRLFQGKVKKGDQIKFLATEALAEVLQIGYLTPSPKYVNELTSGEVGFIVTNLKDLSRVKVGDTITNAQNTAPALPGYQEAKPVVFLSFFPVDSADFPKLKEALSQLRLNDSSLSFEPESSVSLGHGLRVGFLGLLHAQITQERLEREYDLDLVATSPSVSLMIDGQLVNKPADFNPAARDIREPIAKVTIYAPQRFWGKINTLIHQRRGEVKNIETLGDIQKIDCLMSLLELVVGFYDELKSQTSGYGSFEFEVLDYREAKLVKFDILVNHQPIEGLAQIVHADKAQSTGRKLVEKLKEVIPRQNIPIPIQAAIGSKIIARETIASFRKDVTAKLYGGDVTRKTKLLEKQKKGKKRMKRFGNVDIPQEAFLVVLKI